jgi:CDP-diacylglycerol--glycerol-3-phosphate 3-phosphatidyltransferase
LSALSGTRSAAARAIAALGASPDHLTVIGLLFGAASGYLFYVGRFQWAAAALAFSALCDLFDGEVARVSGRTTRFGAFLDSTLDRLSDAAVIGGIMLYYASLAADRYVVLALAALLGAFLTSYTRARAETLIDRCDVGVFERPERLGVLILGGLAGRVAAALWILAVAGNVTVVQRIVHVRLALKGRAGEPAGGKTVNESGNRHRPS